MHPLVAKLQGTDRRSIGRSHEVVAEVLAHPALFGVLFDAMMASDPVLRMRAADAMEKITAWRPDLLQPHKQQLLDEVALIEQHEIRWHVAQMIPRLQLTAAERSTWVDLLLSYLDDRSQIVKTSAMQALAELTEHDARLLPRVIGILTDMTSSGGPAVRARGRKLLMRLNSPDRTF